MTTTPRAKVDRPDDAGSDALEAEALPRKRPTRPTPDLADSTDETAEDKPEVRVKAPGTPPKGSAPDDESESNQRLQRRARHRTRRGTAEPAGEAAAEPAGEASREAPPRTTRA